MFWSLSPFARREWAISLPQVLTITTETRGGKEKERSRQYYLQNKDKTLERDKQYYLNNKEEILKKKKEYRLANKRTIKERKRQYYFKNKEAKQVRDRQYRLENKGSHHLNKLSPVSRRSWKEPSHVRAFLESLHAPLLIGSPTDWYRISVHQIMKLGG
eukprot:TRINITY_DN14120_c0_g1_i1.p1 TRINITY_DN14120_c0_g1~~TRINITY_DN14120_c0_g1_i1.p1  ORF type:complete len:159 (-),score=29.22 TRINITY_DN14120_c0_g1_i1:179-655(-)